MTSDDYSKKATGNLAVIQHLRGCLQKMEWKMEDLNKEYTESFKFKYGDYVRVTRPSGVYEGFIVGFFLNAFGTGSITLFIGPRVNVTKKDTIPLYEVMPEDIDILESYEPRRIHQVI